MSTENKTVNMRWGKWLVATLVLGILTFITSPSAPLGHFWGLHNIESPTPSGVQMPLLLILNAIQSLAFGFGVAFLLFGWAYVKAIVPTNHGLAFALHLAISWSLISWWPHSSFHQSLKAGNISGLLAIEYGFHVTVILGAVLVAYAFLTKIRQDGRN
jgi:hypothetical protein